MAMQNIYRTVAMGATDYATRINDLVERSVNGKVIAFIQFRVYEDVEREYWERLFYTVSHRDSYMVHQANLDSEGEAMLIHGAYDMGRSEAMNLMLTKATASGAFRKDQ